jgi:hypothetical protein
MTRYPLFSILFLVAVSVVINTTSREDRKAFMASAYSIKSADFSHSEPIGHDLPLSHIPAAKPTEPVKESHGTKLEEVAHIHHFHKERVKKLKRHHEKFWILSKILLILCHLLLLVVAYLHVTH